MRVEAQPPPLPTRQRLTFRQLRAEETDWELLSLVFSGCASACAAFWLGWDLPRPVCPLKALTGCPCPACGGTRAVLQLLNGNILGALHWNPLATVGFVGLAVFNLYAAIVLALRAPRLRFMRRDPGFPLPVTLGIVGAVVGNWAWLLWRGE